MKMDYMLGLVRLPKWSHLKELHEAIKLCEQTLLYGTSKFLSLGSHQEVTVFFCSYDIVSLPSSKPSISLRVCISTLTPKYIHFMHN